MKKKSTFVCLAKNNKLRYPNLIFLLQWFSILTMSSFLEFIAISLKFVCRTESVQQRKHWVGHKNGQKTTFFLTKQWFLCCTDSVRQTSSKEMAKNAKKGDMVKIENHCTKKIRLGYLNCPKWKFGMFKKTKWKYLFIAEL